MELPIGGAQSGLDGRQDDVEGGALDEGHAGGRMVAASLQRPSEQGWSVPQLARESQPGTELLQDATTVDETDQNVG